MITFEDRQRIKHERDQAKRAEIAAAHGRTLESILGKIGECEHCEAVIPDTRRFCGQECITAHRAATRRAVA